MTKAQVIRARPNSRARDVEPSIGVIPAARGGEGGVQTATMKAGATSGWHRHPGGTIALVKSGSLTTYGLDREPWVGECIATGVAYFEDEAANAHYPHFVRNRGDVPVELVCRHLQLPARWLTLQRRCHPARMP